MDFDELRKANEQRHTEWANGESLPLSFRGVELAGEVGEACNEDLSGLCEELADVLICVDLIAMDLGIDLGEVVRAKFNVTSEKYGLETRL